MLFHSFNFVFIFLPIVIAGFFVCAKYLGQQKALMFLLLSSAYFYGSWNPAYLLLLYGSITGNYVASRILAAARNSGRSQAGSLLVGLFSFLNLAALGYFKYFNFFIENANTAFDLSFVSEEIILPLAISFFTFQQIAFLVDVHRGLAREHSILEYALFVSFFPQLIAGPIVHHGELIPQFHKPETFRFNLTNFSDGTSIFMLGVFKKVALADQFEPYANNVFEAAQSGSDVSFFAAWGGVLSFSFQIFFDFSAYSDMAIGIARIFGINLPINFNAPYKATNIIEFWRRWHITLSRFLRDYLYISLGGNRKGKTRRYINVLITMVLGGLWHGAAWTFVIWGALHGLYIIVNYLWRRLTKGILPDRPGLVGRAFGWGLTFIAVAIAWVFFRADSFASAMSLLEGMAGLNGVFLPAQLLTQLPFLEALADPMTVVPFLGGGTLIGSVNMAVLMAGAFLLVLFGRPLHRLSLNLRLALLVPTAAFCFQHLVFGPETQTFIYFQF